MGAVMKKKRIPRKKLILSFYNVTGDWCGETYWVKSYKEAINLILKARRKGSKDEVYLDFIDFRKTYSTYNI